MTQEKMSCVAACKKSSAGVKIFRITLKILFEDKMICKFARKITWLENCICLNVFPFNCKNCFNSMLKLNTLHVTFIHFYSFFLWVVGENIQSRETLFWIVIKMCTCVAITSWESQKEKKNSPDHQEQIQNAAMCF